MDHEGIRPDMLVLGKSLSGGTIPVSVNHMINGDDSHSLH